MSEVIAAVAGRLAIVLLDAHIDGISQMFHHLRARQGIQNLLISTVDEPSALTLGSASVTVGNLYAYEDTLRRIGNAMRPSGRIILLGRGVHSGRSDAALLAMLSRLAGVAVVDDQRPPEQLADFPAAGWPAAA